MEKWRWTTILVMLWFLIVLKIAFSLIQAVIFFGCLITDGETTANCKNFTFVPFRAFVEPISPGTSAAVSVIWILVSLQLEQAFPNVRETLRMVIRKLYFYKDGFLVFWLIVYYLIVFFSDPGRPGAIDYIVLPVELVTSTLLMYVLNYKRAPSDMDRDNHPGIAAIYKTILITWAMHNFYHVLVDTIYVGMNIYTFSEKKAHNHQKAWHSINLLFLVIAGTYRYIMGNFYLTKFSCSLKQKEYMILRDEDDDLRLPYVPYADIDDIL